MGDQPRDIQLLKLTERAKELRCIYQIMETLKNEGADLHVIFRSVLDVIPPGWQHPTVCEAKIIFEGKEYATLDFRETQWMQEAEIIIDNHISGRLQVVYLQKVFDKENPFLPEEQKLLNTIAENLSHFIFFRRVKSTLEISQTPGSRIDSADDRSLLAYESDEHWKWRYRMAEKIAENLNFDKYGIVAVYLIGSTKNATAGPGSDIDLMIHFMGSENQRSTLESLMEGWGRGLAELNYTRTGYRILGSLIDLHIITDKDIQDKSSYASMISSKENSAKLLRSIKND